MEIAVLNINGKYTGRNVFLDNSIFDLDPNYHVVYLDINRYFNSQRQGTHHTKTRSEVTGSNRKLHRQKGLGCSRKGDINNPLFRGGGRVFGPRSRTYRLKLNKSVKTLAKRSIISYKLKYNQLRIVEDFSFELPNTKNILNILKLLRVESTKILFVVSNTNKNLSVSTRNIKTIKFVRVQNLNSYLMLNAFYIVFLESSIEHLKL